MYTQSPTNPLINPKERKLKKNKNKLAQSSLVEINQIYKTPK